jgi:transcriptional regulator with XRE-family HTH domain
MVFPDVDVGANIRALRKRRRLSLNELSRLTGISASNLSHMELGKSAPTLSTLAKIAAALGMKAGALLDEVLSREMVLCRRGEGREVPSGRKDVRIVGLTPGTEADELEAVRITMQPDHHPLALSQLQYDLFVHCLSGEATVEWEGEQRVLGAGDSLYVLPEAAVQFISVSGLETELLMVTRKSKSGNSLIHDLIGA